MISYTKLSVYNIILVITIFIFIFLNIVIDSVINLNNVEQVEAFENEIQTKELTEYIKEENINKENCWSIEIPAINLKADIAEGTSDDVMNKYVGHFENTEIWEGNIGLAAHNRRLSRKLFWKN